jgi:hypothetical protein
MAGERVVIAQLVIDEKGAVAAIDKTTAAQTRLARETNTTASAFTARMFSMRQAAQAFLGGFTLAGAIVGMKNFTEGIAKTDTAYQQFTESVKTSTRAVQDFFRPFVHAALIETANGINTLGKAFGTFFGTFKSGYDSLGAKGKAAFWTLTAMLGGVMGAGAAKSVLGMGGDTRLEDEAGIYGPPGPQGYGQFKPYNPTGGIRYAPMAVKLEQPPNLADTVRDMSLMAPLAEKIGTGWETTAEAMQKVKETDLGPLMSDTLELDQSMERLGDSLTKAGLKFDLITGAALLFAQEFGQAIAEGGISFRKFMADMLMFVGQTLLAWGALGLVTAYFGYGPGLKASAIAFAAGAAAMAAARVIGGGREHAGAGGAGASAAAGGGGGGHSTSVNVSLEGAHIFGANPDDLARWLTVKIQKALGDGAGGGDINTAPVSG